MISRFQLLLVCALCLQAPSAFAQNFTLTRAVSGLFQPVDLAFNDAENRHYIVEKPGRIRIWNANGLVPQPYLDITGRVNNSGGEQGLLGLAFSPNFAVDSSLFVYYITFPNRTRISRFRAGVGATSVDEASEQILLEFNQPRGNHNGGSLAFGPDGYLYITSGDGGGAGDPDNFAQNLSSYLGKILRIDVTSNPGTYSVPADNPFVNTSGALPEIWSYGWRNPWRHSFDRLTGDMWIADVGQNAREEINREAADAPGGANYGWRCREGEIPFNLSGDCDGPFAEPVHTYVTNELADGCSVSGGAVYRGVDYPAMYGNYYYTDFCSGKIFELSPLGAGAYSNQEILDGQPQQYAAIRENRAGELFVIAFVEGALYQLTTSCPDLGGVFVEQPTCADELGMVRFDPASPDSTYNLTYTVGASGVSADGLESGDYELLVEGSAGCSKTYNFTIQAGEMLSPPDVQMLNDSTFVVGDTTRFDSYQWYLDDVALAGETGPTFQARGVGGTLTLEATSAVGCTYLSPDVFILSTATRDLVEELGLRVFPNPVLHSLKLSSTKPSRISAVEVTSLAGRVIDLESSGSSIADFRLDLSTTALPAGIYLLHLTTQSGVAVLPFVKQLE